MSPKEKAQELFDKYYFAIKDHKYHYVTQTSKQCALIAVKEVLSVYKSLSEDDDILFPKETEYWQQVKTEIENL